MPTIKLALRLAAFLDLVAESEGTCSSPATHADGYDIIITGVDGPNTFTDYSHHPFSLGRAPILVRRAVYACDDDDRSLSGGRPGNTTIKTPALYSTASGRYQITHATWGHLMQVYKLGTFSPQSQDLACLHLLDECHATELLLKADVDGAIAAAADVWASFPGNLYNQGGHALGWLLTKYQEALQRNR